MEFKPGVTSDTDSNDFDRLLQRVKEGYEQDQMEIQEQERACGADSDDAESDCELFSVEIRECEEDWYSDAAAQYGEDEPWFPPWAEEDLEIDTRLSILQGVLFQRGVTRRVTTRDLKRAERRATLRWKLEMQGRKDYEAWQESRDRGGSQDIAESRDEWLRRNMREKYGEQAAANHEVWKRNKKSRVMADTGCSQPVGAYEEDRSRTKGYEDPEPDDAPGLNEISSVLNPLRMRSLRRHWMKLNKLKQPLRMRMPVRK